MEKYVVRNRRAKRYSDATYCGEKYFNAKQRIQNEFDATFSIYFR